ncbi:ESPR-type extended signal peptide-containing protein, partial [Phocoenobacter skyensis]
MNSIYKIVFNKATQTFTAVSELAKGATKTQSQSAKQAGTFLPKFAKITLAISMVLGFSASVMAVTDAEFNELKQQVEALKSQKTYVHVNNGTNAGTGDATTNLGDISTAGGAKTIHSIAIGEGAIAGGSSTIEHLNDGREIEEKKDSSIAIGYMAKAIGEGSVAIGGRHNHIVSDNASTSDFYEAIASGRASVAIGNSSKSTGSYSIAAGYKAKAMGAYSLALGGEGTATGRFSATLGGDANIASGSISTAMGYRSIALGRISTSMGYATIASGVLSTVMGNRSMSSGESSVAMGYRTEAVGVNSLATNQRAKALGDGSTAMGYASKAFGAGALAAGGVVSNDPYVPGGKNIYYYFNREDFDGLKTAYSDVFTADVAAQLDALETKAEKEDFAEAKILESKKIGGGLAYTDGSIALGTGTVAGKRVLTVQEVDKATIAQRAQDKGLTLDYKPEDRYDTGLESLIEKELVLEGKELTSENKDERRDELAVLLGEAQEPYEEARKLEAVAMGYRAKATEDKSIALGFDAKAEHTNSVALGSNAETRDFTQVDGTKAINGLKYKEFSGIADGVVSVGKTAHEKQIINVAPGEISQTSTDAINGSQLYATTIVLGNVATSVKDNLGGNAAIDENGNITFTDIGGTGKDTIQEAIAFNKGNIETNTANIEGNRTAIATKADKNADNLSVADVNAWTVKLNNEADLAAPKGKLVTDTQVKAALETKLETSDIKSSDKTVGITTAAGKVDLRVNLDNTSLTKNGNGVISIADGGVTTAKIADGNVTKAKLADEVTTILDKVGTGAIETANHNT